MRQPHALTTHCVFALIVAVYATTAIYFPIAYIWGTYEDLIGEWTQFWLFIATFVVSTRLLFLSTRYRLTFAALAICCFYVSMEEISWGQRLFGFATPDFFKAHNLQSETNFHNFVAGPFSTTLKASIGYALAGAMVAYGLVYPLLLRTKNRLASWSDARGLAAPPLWLAPFFVLAGFLEVTPFGFNEAEVAELLVGFGVFFTTIHYAFAVSRDLVPLQSGEWNPRARASLAVRFALTAFVVVSVASNTALGIYATPSGRARIDNRVSNGLEKFARRYGRYGQWTTSVALMRRVLDRKPNSRSTLRRLAEALRNTGDEIGAERYLQQALKLDLKKLKQNPRSSSLQRSLIRTYRALGDQENARRHEHEALRIGLERVTKHPESANAAYSLGRTYSLLGRDAEALKELERAYRLKPTSKTFKKAYINAKY